MRIPEISTDLMRTPSIHMKNQFNHKETMRNL